MESIQSILKKCLPKRCIACGFEILHFPSWIWCTDCWAWLKYIEEQEMIRNSHIVASGVENI